MRLRCSPMKRPVTSMATEAVSVSSAPAAKTAADAIVIEGLVRRFGEREALAGVSARVGIGQTLAVLGEAGLLLLDEPLAGLDPDAESLVEPLIGRCAGRTRVPVTHDVERSLDEADQVIGLRRGHVVLSAPARDLEPSQLRALYHG